MTTKLVELFLSLTADELDEINYVLANRKEEKDREEAASQASYLHSISHCKRCDSAVSVREKRARCDNCGQHRPIQEI
jgi:Zn finger protein HypA/HybF involved in hydrogenase expression